MENYNMMTANKLVQKIACFSVKLVNKLSHLHLDWFTIIYNKSTLMYTSQHNEL